MVSNFLMGGKLGDFLHAMFAVKQICLSNNIKANIYMYDIGWEFGIEHTHAELSPIFLQQDYVESFNILTEYKLDPIQNPNQNSSIQIYNQKLLREGYIDLGSYIRSPWLYQVCWSDLYSKTFNFKIQQPYHWIEYNKINSELQNKILIQRKYNPYIFNTEFPYQYLIDHYGRENFIFISSSEKDYNEFLYKDQIDFYKITTLEEWFTSINSCLMIIANLSAPAVMAHSLDKLRIIELPNIPDSKHCMGEEKYSSNIRWYLNNSLNNLI
jgi:hypothetical protein